MKSSRKRYRTVFLTIFILLAGLAGYLFWNHNWYSSPQVKSNIFKLEALLRAHRGEIWSAKYSGDGKYFASAGVDSSVILWSAATAQPQRVLRQPTGVTNLALSPRNNVGATGGYDGKVRLWDLSTGHTIRTLGGHTGTVWSVAFSPDGTLLASCGEDLVIRIWNVATGAMLHALRGHTRNVWDVKFNHSGTLLASGSFDATIRVWNVATGSLEKVLRDHTEAVVALAFSHAGRLLASTSDDGAIKVWDTNTWTVKHSFAVPEHNQAADFSPDDTWLITGGRDKPSLGEFTQNFFGNAEKNKGVSMRLWDLTTGTLLQTFSAHGNDVNDVSFSPDGRWIVSASSDKTVGLWRRSE